MDLINASYRVSNWENAEELHKVYKLIYSEKASVDDKKEAFQILQVWKARRCDETAAGVLCSLSLLDVYLKDITKEITDPFTLSTLYASTLTKFINFATNFQSQETSMYRSAYKLGIESFLIDLRHLCAHGKTLPSIEVFRKSHRYCLDWIKKFYWEKEIDNVTDATIQDIRYDSVLAAKLKKIFPFYDTLAELLRRNIVDFQDVEAKAMTNKRWPLLEKFMKENKLKDFRQGFKFLTKELTKIIESKLMNQNSRTFFHEMFELCDFFMKAVEVKDTEAQDSSDEEAPKPKKKKKEPQSIVTLYQNLIWQIAKHDHLKLFIDMLYQLSINENEDSSRRASSRFWICTVLRSFMYYQRYCQFSKESAMLPTKVTEEIKKIYRYQFDADLKKVFIFAGTQQLPTSLKYSREMLDQLLSNVTVETSDLCTCLLPFAYPPLSEEQLEHFNNLITISTGEMKEGNCSGKSKERNSSGKSKERNSSGKLKDSFSSGNMKNSLNPGDTEESGKVEEDKIFTIEDLMQAAGEKTEEENSNMIWQISNDDIDWSSVPIGKNFKIQV